MLAKQENLALMGVYKTHKQTKSLPYVTLLYGLYKIVIVIKETEALCKFEFIYDIKYIINCQ